MSYERIRYQPLVQILEAYCKGEKAEAQAMALLLGCDGILQDVTKAVADFYKGPGSLGMSRLSFLEFLLESSDERVAQASKKALETLLSAVCSQGDVGAFRFLRGLQGKYAPEHQSWLLSYQQICRTGDVEFLKVFLEEVSEVKSPRLFGGISAACERGHYDVVEFLINQKVEDVTAVPSSDMSPLLGALCGGNQEILDLLFDSGVSVTVAGRDVPDFHFMNVDRWSNWSKEAEVTRSIEYLIAHHKIAPPATALHSAARRGWVKLVTVFLAFGCDPNSQDSLGYTPLMASIMRNPSTTIPAMLLDAGADINAFNPLNDRNALMLCATHSCASVKMANFLIKFGVDVLANDSKGRSIVDLVPIYTEHREARRLSEETVNPRQVFFGYIPKKGFRLLIERKTRKALRQRAAKPKALELVEKPKTDNAIECEADQLVFFAALKSA